MKVFTASLGADMLSFRDKHWLGKGEDTKG